MMTRYEKRVYKLYVKLNVSYARLKEIQKGEYKPKEGPSIIRSDDKCLDDYLRLKYK